jgi:hypothetical protein
MADKARAEATTQAEFWLRNFRSSESDYKAACRLLTNAGDTIRVRSRMFLAAAAAAVASLVVHAVR